MLSKLWLVLTSLTFIAGIPLPKQSPELSLNCFGGGQVKFYDVTKSRTFAPAGMKLKKSQIMTECTYTKTGTRTYNLTMTNLTVPDQWPYQKWRVSSLLEYYQTFDFRIDYTLYIDNHTNQLPNMTFIGASTNLLVLNKNATNPKDYVNLTINNYVFKVYRTVYTWLWNEILPKSVIFYDNDLPYVIHFNKIQIILPIVKVHAAHPVRKTSVLKAHPSEVSWKGSVIVQIIFLLLVIIVLWLIRVKVNCSVVTRREDLDPDTVKQQQQPKQKKELRKKDLSNLKRIYHSAHRFVKK